MSPISAAHFIYKSISIFRAKMDSNTLQSGLVTRLGKSNTLAVLLAKFKFVLTY